MCNLLEALDCENEEIVIAAFVERYDVSWEEAQDIFNETKKWLWLTSQAAETDNEKLIIDKPLTIIDEMWHNFILHTKQYYNYCMQKFKKIIHHVPTPPEEKISFLENYDPVVYEKMIKNQYSIIYDRLGPETLVKWYDTLANKYTPDYIQTVKKF